MFSTPAKSLKNTPITSSLRAAVPIWPLATRPISNTPYSALSGTTPQPLIKAPSPIPIVCTKPLQTKPSASRGRRRWNDQRAHLCRVRAENGQGWIAERELHGFQGYEEGDWSFATASSLSASNLLVPITRHTIGKPVTDMPLPMPSLLTKPSRSPSHSRLPPLAVIHKRQ